jgi:hypothetical protein
MRLIGILLAGIAIIFTSCMASHEGMTSNANLHTTEVVLSKKNFKVIARIKGEAKATYIFGIGGFSKSALIATAKADMLAKADIVGGAKAIVNETVEVKNSFYAGVVIIKRVIVSANIVEFTE